MLENIYTKHTLQKTKHNPVKANNAKYSRTKLVQSAHHNWNIPERLYTEVTS